MTQYQDTCPYCGSACDCELVDVGVGMVQSGPYLCDNCHAFEIHPDELESDSYTDEEKKVGWARGMPAENREIMSKLIKASREESK